MADHSLYVADCKIMELTGVSSVNTFDEEQIILDTNSGYLGINGSNLHITNLNLDEGKVAIHGDIISMEYRTQGVSLKSKGKNLLTRLLK